jgi:hypothetical protein
MRLISKLSSGFPGTMIAPFFRVANAPSLTSSRTSAIRVPLSGPWQRKQLSESIGLTCRWKFTGGPLADGTSAATETLPPRRNAVKKEKKALRGGTHLIMIEILSGQYPLFITI